MMTASVADKSVVLLSREDYRIMKWKNGNGVSQEIAIFPNHAMFSTDPFLWRLSSAQMTEGGAFSQFAGYDRYITLLEGSGLKLSVGANHQEILVRKGEAHQFSGDEVVTSDLLSDAVTDLNLIVRRDQVKATFEVIKLSGKPRSFELEGKVIFIVGVVGSIAVSVYPGEQEFNIRNLDTLRISTEELSSCKQAILLDPKEKHCFLVLIELKF
jgi:environmental stress-induced protein Ves